MSASEAERQERDAEIVRLHRAGVSRSEIARRLGVSYATASTAVRRAIPQEEREVLTRRSHPWADPARNEEIARAYRAGESVAALAGRYGVAEQRIHQIAHSLIPEEEWPAVAEARKAARASLAKARRAEREEAARRRREARAQRDARIVERYQGGAPLDEIAAEVGLTKARVSDVVGKAGVPRRNPRLRGAAAEARDRRIVELYQEGLRDAEIAAHPDVGLSVARVQQIRTRERAVGRPHRSPTATPRPPRPVAPSPEDLRALREACDWAQEDLAAALGVTRELVSRMESGRARLWPYLAYAIEALRARRPPLGR